MLKVTRITTRPVGAGGGGGARLAGGGASGCCFKGCYGPRKKVAISRGFVGWLTAWLTPANLRCRVVEASGLRTAVRPANSEPAHGLDARRAAGPRHGRALLGCGADHAQGRPPLGVDPRGPHRRRVPQPQGSAAPRGHPRQDPDRGAVVCGARHRRGGHPRPAPARSARLDGRCGSGRRSGCAARM